jgi:protein-disulfide isomerase
MRKLLLVFLFLLTVPGVQAQKAERTPTPTPFPPEETAVATAEADEERPASLSEAIDDLPQSRTEDGAYVLGDPDAPVTIIDFSDWACPHCQEYREVLEMTLLEYVLAGQVKFEFRVLPTAGGMTTVFAAQVAECAEDLQEGGFWQSYILLFDLALANDYDQDTISATIAQELDVDEDELLACAEDARQVLTDATLANEMGISGTPGIMVRYDDGDPEFIEVEGVVYDRGGVPPAILIAAIEAALDSEGASAGSK